MSGKQGHGSGYGWLRVGAAFLLMLGAMLATVFGAGQAVAQEEAEADATVRFVHASPGTPNVDILVNGQPVAEDLAYGDVTNFVAVPGGDHTVQVVPTGQTTEGAVIDTDLNVDSGGAYIFVAMGRLNDIEGNVYEVNLDDLDEGKARVRVINASADAGDIDVAISGGDTVADDVGFSDTSDYTDLDTGTYSLDVKDQDGRVLVTAADVLIDAGNAYDIITLGLQEDQSLALLPLVTRVAEPCASVLGLEATAADACLRVVHAIPGGPAVDVYVNGSPVVENLTFGMATEFATVPGGDDRTLEITTTGTPPGDEDIVDQEVDLTGGTAYQIVAMGDPGDVSAEVMRLDLTPVPAGQARVRVVHASTDSGNVDVGFAQGETLFEDVAFKDRPPYKIVNEGAVTLQARGAGEDTILIEADSAIEEGLVYDIIIIGRTADQSLSLLVLSAPAPVRQGDVATPVGGTPSPVTGTTGGTPVGTVEVEMDEAETPTP